MFKSDAMETLVTVCLVHGNPETAAVWEAQIEQTGIGSARSYGHDAIAGSRRDGQYRMTACLEHRRESLAQNAIVVTQGNSHLRPSLPSGTCGKQP